MLLNFIHYADIQIEIRVSGLNSQRLDEYLAVLQKMENIVKSKQPDIVFIPGDIFEHCDTNGDEAKIFSKHLHAILPHTKRIILIPGNHDIKQRSNGILYLDSKQNAADSIDAVVTAINNPKISYYKHSGLYKDSTFPITYAVWSQIDKWSAQEPKPNYNPWIDNQVPDGAMIELFHDPIKGAKDFSGQPSEHFTNYGISLSDFRANTIIAGDIHSPDIIWFGENNERLFTYSSSLVQRNSGEGDYWSNITKIQSGNNKHGYNEISFDTELNKVTSCTFIPIHNPISRHTIRLNEHFNYETMIQTLQIDSTEFNKIRVICHAKLNEFIEHEQDIIEHFRSKYKCSVSTDWAKDVIDVQVDESEFENLDQVIDKDKILDISKKYIKTIVAKSSTISKDDKQAAEDLIFEIFEKELASAELISNRTSITLIDADISNFMSFANNVSVSFKNNDICVISGTNGVGKTTLFHFLKWIFCDKISEHQNDRNKKYNYSLYFNDSSDDDVVLGQIRFNVNGNNLYTVKKTLTREWKKNTKDIRDKNWIDNLKSTPTIGMSIESNDFNSTDTQACIDHLSSLITYKELSRLVFVNGASLSNLINTSPEDLSSDFLNILGLDFLNNILSTFDSVKDDKLSKLTKPDSTIEDVLKTIENVELNQTQSDEKIFKYENELLIFKSEQETKDKLLNDKRSTLHQVGTKDEINSEIDKLVDDAKEFQLEIEGFKSTIADFNKDKEIHTIESITTDIHKKQLELVDAKNALDSHNIKVVNDEKNIEALRQNVTSVAIEIKLKLNEDIAKHTQVKDVQSKVLTEKKEAKSQILKDYQSKIQESITKINNGIDEKDASKNALIEQKNEMFNNINQINNENDALKSTNSTLNSQIESLKNSKVCPTCEQEKSKDAITKIEQQIEEIRSTIQKHNETIDKNALIVESKRIEHDVILKSIEKIDAEIKTYKDLRDKFANKLNVIDGEKYPELLTADIKLSNEIVEINTSIEKIDAEIKTISDNMTSSIQSDKKYIDACKAMNDAKELLETFKQSLDSKEQAVNIIEKDIQSLNTLRDDISKIDVKIAEQNKLISDVNEKIEKNTQQHMKLLGDIEFANINVEIKAEIQRLETERFDHNEEFEMLKRELEKEKLSSTRYNDKLEELNITIDNIKKYKLVESALKLYKKLLGKTGLPQYIFAHLVPLINKKLNDTLENVDFRLLFEQESLELRFIDLKKNISRPVQFVSGMQETLTGLALINIFRILNNSKVFNLLMIDEISGKLNDGKDLTYESKNYKKLATDFIHKLSTNVNIYIIDHVLEFRNARKLEVQPTDSGAIIVEINN